MIFLYPTETLYGLGVNPFSKEDAEALLALTERGEDKTASWLVKGTDEIRKYAEVSERAAKIAERFLPGPLTLVLKANQQTLRGLTPKSGVVSKEGTIGFRISSDPIAQKLINEMDTPLTCTSANISGKPTHSTTTEILKQFGEKAKMIDRVIDDGPREGVSSTVVQITDDEVVIIREGAIPSDAILKIC